MTAKANKKTKPQKKKPASGKKTGHAAEVLEATDAGFSEVEKIRDIIFGAQMASYEKRFSRLEDRIQTQIEDLRKESTDQIKHLETVIQENRDVQNRNLKDEQVERDKSEKTLSREIADAAKSLHSAIETLSARHVQDIQHFQEQLTAASEDLAGELNSLQVETAKNLEAAVQDLEDDKLARQSLSHLLQELADRL